MVTPTGAVAALLFRASTVAFPFSAVSGVRDDDVSLTSCRMITANSDILNSKTAVEVSIVLIKLRRLLYNFFSAFSRASIFCLPGSFSLGFPRFDCILFIFLQTTIDRTHHA